jgi:hypothetical protein
MSFGMAGGAVPATTTSIPPIPLSETGTRASVGVGATILTNPPSMFESANRTRIAFYDPPPISHQNIISNVGWKRPFQQIADPEPGHLRAFGRSGELVDSVNDDNVGRGV